MKTKKINILFLIALLTACFPLRVIRAEGPGQGQVFNGFEPNDVLYPYFNKHLPPPDEFTAVFGAHGSTAGRGSINNLLRSNIGNLSPYTQNVVLFSCKIAQPGSATYYDPATGAERVSYIHGLSRATDVLDAAGVRRVVALRGVQYGFDRYGPQAYDEVTGALAPHERWAVVNPQTRGVRPAELKDLDLVCSNYRRMAERNFRRISLQTTGKEPIFRSQMPKCSEVTGVKGGAPAATRTLYKMPMAKGAVAGGIAIAGGQYLLDSAAVNAAMAKANGDEHSAGLAYYGERLIAVAETQDAWRKDVMGENPELEALGFWERNWRKLISSMALSCDSGIMM